jgi:hypothetical protein
VKATTGSIALNIAMNAGFEILRHGVDRRRGTYTHVLVHADGRSLAIDTTLNQGRLVSVHGQDRARWSTRRLSARSVPALRSMLATA